MFPLEIIGIEKTPNEQLDVILESISANIGVTYDSSDYTNIYRLPGGVKQIPIIRIIFATKKLRDNWLKHFKSSNITGNVINKALKNNKIYANEQLTPLNKKILYETKQVAKAKNYKYVWVSDGKIFVRKDDNLKANKIKTLNDVQAI